MAYLTKHCGYVAIIGRPNVGKSTLLNKILAQKISITSSKAQTTRHRILGVKTEGDTQTIYVDTPGLHWGKKIALNKYMNKVALSAIQDVDVVIWVVAGLSWKKEDDLILRSLQKVRCPVLLVVNKVDEVKPKAALLPYLAKVSAKMDFVAVLPLSAKDGTNVSDLEKKLASLLPESPHFFFPEDQVTDRDERFLASEIIREKLIRLLQDELPYSTTVVIDIFKHEEKHLHIAATIFVERPGQKLIIIGKGGEQLKQIGSLARIEMEKTFESKIFLELWVKVKSSWSDDESSLKKMGYC
jgi:GTPase